MNRTLESWYKVQKLKSQEQQGFNLIYRNIDINTVSIDKLHILSLKEFHPIIILHVLEGTDNVPKNKLIQEKLRKDLQNKKNLQFCSNGIIVETTSKIDENLKSKPPRHWQVKLKNTTVRKRKTNTIFDTLKIDSNTNEKEKRITQKFSYLYPIIAIRNSILDPHQFKGLETYDEIHEYLKSITFINDIFAPNNPFLYKMKPRPWYTTLYTHYIQSKVIHYYNLLFILMEVGGGLMQNRTNYRTDLNFAKRIQMIPFDNQNQRQRWEQIDVTDMNEQLLQNNIAQDHDSTKIDHEYILYKKETFKNVSLRCLNIETNINHLKEKLKLFFREQNWWNSDKDKTTKYYNALHNWNYSVFDLGFDDQGYKTVLQRVLDFTTWQQQILEQEFNIPMNFNREMKIHISTNRYNINDVNFLSSANIIDNGELKTTVLKEQVDVYEDEEESNRVKQIKNALINQVDEDLYLWVEKIENMLKTLYSGDYTERNSSSNNNDNVDLTNETSSDDESDTGQWLLKDLKKQKPVPRTKYLNQYILC